MNPGEIEEFIEEAFEDNFNYLKRESTHTISPALKDMALHQVKLYWQKLRHIALSVSETEVKLTLAEQKTPTGRRFSLEGIVDIVQEDGKYVLYDIKTHEASQVKSNEQLYLQQLNVYAHMWQTLRNKNLEGIAVIATAPPKELTEALANGDEKAVAKEIERWNPVVKLGCDDSAVQQCIADFGKTIDNIEECRFSPSPTSKLNDNVPGRDEKFGTAVCRYCDGRFGCSSYREFMKKRNRKLDMVYFLNDYGDENEQEQWRDLLLDSGADTI